MIKKKHTKYNKGITLVALVVTIVVLLILAGVTIMYVMGDNSIFKQAQKAKNETEDAMKNEQEYLNNLDNTINEYFNGSALNNRIDIATIMQKVDKNTLAKDSLANLITIPEGFKVVPDGQDGVEYTYTGDKIPTVQDGIVIEDDEGNQFVWIPVGNIKNKDGSTTTIQLARYTFDITLKSKYEVSGGSGAVKKIITDGRGTTDEWMEKFGEGCEFLEEDSSSTTYGNTKAKDIEEFKKSAKANGGYYLARYEASRGEDNKAKSKMAAVWNNITQPASAAAAREMYESQKFESDLVNSYAWDTAIVFIQTYSGDNDYSKELGTKYNKSLVKTGTNGDKRCNIYDMASNTVEWTTESCTYPDYFCTGRGGFFGDTVSYPAFRHVNNNASIADVVSFRTLIYLTRLK